MTLSFPAVRERGWGYRMEKPRPFNGRVIFDHLPKTGGSATRVWLVSALGPASVMSVLGGDHRTLIRRFGGEYPIIAAHGSRRRLGQPCLLRTGLARLVSPQPKPVCANK